jgi:hypothetical protein
MAAAGERLSVEQTRRKVAMKPWHAAGWRKAPSFYQVKRAMAKLDEANLLPKK